MSILRRSETQWATLNTPPTYINSETNTGLICTTLWYSEGHKSCNLQVVGICQVVKPPDSESDSSFRIQISSNKSFYETILLLIVMCPVFTFMSMMVSHDGPPEEFVFLLAIPFKHWCMHLKPIEVICFSPHQEHHELPPELHRPTVATCCFLYSPEPQSSDNYLHPL